MSEKTEKKSDPKLELEAGNKVRHPKWGAGKVLDVFGTGDDAKVRVAFETEGEKRLLVKYSKLKKI